MRRIRICLVSPPYSGHLNPMLAVGKALVDIAEVTVVSTPIGARAAAAANLASHSILAQHESLVVSIVSPGRPVKNNPLRLWRQLKANVSLQSDFLSALNSAIAELRPDLVIADFTLPVAGVAASQHGARWWTAITSPCVFETADSPPAYFGGLKPARSRVGKLRERALRMLTRWFKRAMFFLFRSAFRQVGLESVYRADGSERVFSSEAILACSVREIEFASAFPAHFYFVGPAFYTPPVAAEPPQFVAGKKHVLVTLGTHLGHHKDAVANRLRELSRRCPEWIFHFTDGNSAQTGVERDGNFHRHGFISYDDHLARYDLVVHHAGSGVMLQCLMLGRPVVAMPMDFDQFDNAARLEVAGVALTANLASLEKRICEAMHDSNLAARCRDFTKTLASYDLAKTIRQMVAELDIG
jgi:UDP:flavonoid glycosyltransferase YjiC (YdhE family)